MKRKEITNEKLMFEIAQENKKLSEPLTRALKEVEKLRHELANYQKDKMSLQVICRLHIVVGMNVLMWPPLAPAERKVAAARA